MIYYILKKIDLTEMDFEKIMNDTPLNFLNYPSYFRYLKRIKFFLVFLNKIGIVPDVIIKKYFKFNY